MSFAREIGPRKVGGRYHCAQWGRDYTVLQIEENRPTWPLWRITIRWDDTREVVSHCTAWDPDRDRVITGKDGSPQR